jgi:hypothetical protein
VDVTEDWQSKEIGRAGPESDREQRTGEHARDDSPCWASAPGRRGPLFSRSPGLMMGGIFVLCRPAQSVTGTAAYNDERLRDLEAPVGWGGYVASADSWSRTLWNRQSELLAVASMAVLSIHLRAVCSSPRRSSPVST